MRLIHTRSVQKASSHVIGNVETFIEEDTRNIVHKTVTPQSPSKWAPWDLTQFSQLPSAAPLYFPESHQRPELSSLPKVILVLGKTRSRRVPSLGCRGTESPGWFDVSPKKLCRRLDAWAGPLCWSCPSPVAHSCSLLYHPNSFRRGIFKLNAKFDADSVLYSVILNAMAT